MICKHLQPLEAAIIASGIAETYRGQPWTSNCREWVYFNCGFNEEKIRGKFAVPECVVIHVNDDSRSGREWGFVCTECNDAVMGLHPGDAVGKRQFP